MEQTQTTELEQPDDCLNFRGKAYKDLTFEDMNDVEFRSIDEVDQFYSFYSLVTDFSMRKNKLDKNRAGTLVLRRQLVCSKEGVRRGTEVRQLDVEHRSRPPVNEFDWLDGQQNNDHPIRRTVGHKRNNRQKTGQEKGTKSRRITRENCPTSLTVRLYTERGVYYVSEFVTVHNHELTIANHRQFLRSHRKVNESDVATVNSLRRVSVRTCYAYQFLVQQAGGYEFVGFTLKDLYNKLQGEKAEIMIDGDSQASITWMNMKAMQNPYFYCIFIVDDKGRLANMF
ncbi:hypothetical protein M0R45_035980 [Rubus argutus]|uniref:FAR1 domain-containing protein n=1 Tax=Rubus argutus TaxID=59490 RepID=A0AAW1VVS1_RUBAR